MKHRAVLIFSLGISSVVLFSLLWAGIQSTAGVQASDNPAQNNEGSTHAVTTSATVTSTFSYQGRLKEDGAPVTGTRNFIFRLYRDDTCSMQVGSDIVMNNVAVSDGLFNVILGVEHNDFNGQALWLETEVAGTSLNCQPIMASPYALSLRPGAIVSGTVDYDADPFGGAAGKFINADGRGLHVQTRPSSNSFGIKVVQGGGADAVDIDAPNGGGIDIVAQDFGVTAVSTNTTGATLGLYGEANAPDGIGVYGQNNIASGYSGYFAGGDVGVEDSMGIEVLNFDSSVAFLTLGGNGDDGDLFIMNDSFTPTVEFNGFDGNFWIYDGQNEFSTNAIFEVDPSNPNDPFDDDGPSIWGEQTDDFTDMVLKTNDDLFVHLEQTGAGSASGVFQILDGDDTVVCTIFADTGNLSCSGTKSAIVPFEDGVTRALYAVESPVVVFEDFGSAELVNGTAVVEIDPLFAETVNLDVDYQVFLTPVEGWAALYVSEKSPTSFVVTDDNGSANIEFDYRIVAKRQGYEDVRLEPVEDGVSSEAGTVTEPHQEDLQPNHVELLEEQESPPPNIEQTLPDADGNQEGDQ